LRRITRKRSSKRRGRSSATRRKSGQVRERMCGGGNVTVPRVNDKEAVNSKAGAVTVRSEEDNSLRGQAITRTGTELGQGRGVQGEDGGQRWAT